MTNKIRGLENSHVLLWIFKDTCWCNDWRWLGISMIAPTLAVAVYLTIKVREVREEFIHNLAVCWWLCANSVWMIGEFFFDDHTRHLAMVFFAGGLITLAVHYLPKWWSDFVDSFIKEEEFA